MNAPHGRDRPHIFFHSDLDSAYEWRAALATQLRDFTFSIGEVADPGTVDVALLWTVPPQGLKRFTNLRAILSLGAGTDQLEPGQLPSHVPVARMVDPTLTRTMVDYAKTAVFRYHRRFHLFERQSRQGRWKFMPPTMTAATAVGILGLGNIGSEIALALRREGFVVRGWSRTAKRLEDIQTYIGRAGLEIMVGCSSVVLNVLPLTEATRGILSRDLFARFRAGTFLINMGRGRHLVESDLLDAIESGSVADATLDVSTVEPLPPAHPFWNHRSILITPHAAGMASTQTAATAIAANIQRAMRGERLLNQV